MGYLLLLPFLSYSATLLLVTLLTVVFKYGLGWLCFNLFTWVPTYLNFLRRILYAILAIVSLLLFGYGYFMSFYYLFLAASVLLYWSVMLRYNKVSKKTIALEAPYRFEVVKNEVNRAWLTADMLLLTIVLFMTHWDRFVIETWRLQDFERTVTYGYDVEDFFTYPICFF